MTRRPIYLDYHATTPVDPRVLADMLPFFTERFGNPHSRQHAWGWDALKAVDRARGQVAALLNASATEITFTSGATESNNLALKGAAERLRERGNHIVTAATEHKSVLDTCSRLERLGFELTVVGVQRDGLIDLEELRRALKPGTILVSVMAANNEIGTIQPLAEIAAIAHEAGALVHTDAAQAVGKIPIDVRAIEIDLLSLTAHKFYGPKGAGALFVRRAKPRLPLAPQIDGGGQEAGLRSGTLNVPGIVGLGRAAEVCREGMAEESARLAALRDRLLDGLRQRVADVIVNGTLAPRLPLAPQIDGGGQEAGLRSGTLNVPGIVGLGRAAEVCGEGMTEESARLAALRDRLLDGLRQRVAGVIVNGTLAPRLPHNLHVSFDGIEGEALLVSLGDLAVSTGSACSSGSQAASHVLRAIGADSGHARASVRFGLGRSTTAEEVDYAIDRVATVIASLRSKTPAQA